MMLIDGSSHALPVLVNNCPNDASMLAWMVDYSSHNDPNLEFE